MDITFKEVGRGFDEIVRETRRELHGANRAAGRKIERAGKAAVRKGAPRMWGKKLTVKVKKGVRQVDGVSVYFTGFSAGGWAIQEWGTKPHLIKPTAQKALKFAGAGRDRSGFARSADHPGSGGNLAWTKAKARLKAAITPVIKEIYGDALGGGPLMAEKIRYDIDVNARDGVRELDRLGKAGKEAGRDIEQGMEDAESAGKAVAKAMVQSAKDIERELKADKEAAEALGRALGPELVGKIDTGAAVQELKTLGLTADQVKADADALALGLKTVDDIKMDAVRNELTTLDDGIKNVGEKGNQSRSVLANMAGNAAQDLGQLGGIVGTLGVGIGQLAEYATEGSIKLADLAKTAGPMAAISAAMLLIQTAQAKIAAEDAFNAEQVKAYESAIEEVGIGLQAVEERLIALDEIAPEELPGTLEKIKNLVGAVGDEALAALTPWDSLGGSISNLPAVLADLGYSYEQIAAVIAGGTPALEAFEEELENTAAAEGLTGPIIDALRRQQEGYADALGVTTDQLADQSGLHATAASEAQFYADSMGGVEQALQDANDETSLANEMWGVLIADMKDGNGLTEQSVDVWNRLRDMLNLSKTEMAEIADEKLNEQIEKDNAAAEEMAGTIAELAQELNDTGRAAADARRIMSSAEWGQTSLEGATGAFSDYFDQVNQFNQNVADQEAAWDSLDEVIEETGGHLIDFTGPEGRGTWDALQELGATIVPDLARAWADADGDQEQFRQSANQIAQTTLTRLQDELGLSEEAAQQYIDVLGLTPEDVETQIQLAGDAEAVLQLQLLQGYIDTLSEGAQAEIAMHILADDPQAAVAVVQRELDQTSTSVDLGLDTDPAKRAYQAFQLWLALHALEVAINARRGTGWGGYGGGGGGAFPVMAAPTAATRGGVAVMAAPAPITINVPIHAAVIGDRYDVQRVVTRSVRGAVRLAGVRER